jgi:hypothetical protein
MKIMNFSSDTKINRSVEKCFLLHPTLQTVCTHAEITAIARATITGRKFPVVIEKKSSHSQLFIQHKNDS